MEELSNNKVEELANDTGMHEEIENEHLLHGDGMDLHDLDELSFDQLHELAKNAIILTPSVAVKRLKQIKSQYISSLIERKKNEPEDVENPLDVEQYRTQFDLLMTTAEEALDEEKKRRTAERQSNYSKKLALLASLTNITENDETEETIEQVKQIQREWKAIRNVPKEKEQELWDKYHFILDTFYDNHSINIELKELDRKKNLEIKIELTKKVEALKNEKSLKKSYILLNKYHEEFRNTGPIPKESREAIWNAFKAASDEIYDLNKAKQDEINNERGENLKKKQLLIEKAAVLAQLSYDSISDWNAKTKAMDAIFDEWKKIGPVPHPQSDAIWEAFNAERNTFYSHKKGFLSVVNKERKDNLKKKEELCIQVEAIKDSTDFDNTTKEILNIQKKWKKIGPVPNRMNQVIWKRFRSACDHFFARKEETFKSQRESEKANLELKQGLLKEMEGLLQSEEEEKKIFEELKRIGSAWHSIGHIPRKNMKNINDRYNKITDTIFSKYKKSKSDLNAEEQKEHFRQIALAPNGLKRLKEMEVGIRKKIGHLNSEVVTLEQNMGFFASSKTANAMLKDFEKKVENTKAQIDKLKAELRLISQAKKVQD